MNQELQEFIVAGLVIIAVIWLIIRARKMKNNPCASCSFCPSKNIRNDNALPSVFPSASGTTVDPAPPIDQENHTSDTTLHKPD